MKVKDLIKELKKLPPNFEVVLTDNKDYATTCPAWSVEVGHFDGQETFLDEDDFRDMNSDPEGHYPDNAVKIS